MPSIMSKFVFTSVVAVALTSASTSVSANPGSASKCDLWTTEGGGFGPHQQTLTANGNAATAPSGSQYTPGKAIPITIVSGGTYQGFQITATDSTGRRVGTFATTANSANLVKDQGCTGADPTKPNNIGSTFSHSDSTAKPNGMLLNWTPDAAAVGSVVFQATVMPQSGAFYKATVLTIPRSAAAPAPIKVVDPTAPIAEAPVAAPAPAPVAGPVQTVPTNGQKSLVGLQDAVAFNPYKKQAPKPVAVASPPTAALPPASGAQPVKGTAPVSSIGGSQAPLAPGQVVGTFGASRSAYAESAMSSTNEESYMEEESSAQTLATSTAAVLTISAIVAALTL